MKRIAWRLLVAGAGLAWGTAGGTAVAAAPAAAEEEATVVTSDRLTFDYKQRYALFEEHVVVTDPQMQLTADKLTVIFDANSAIQSLKAEGHVNIRQADKVATSSVATYDVASGKIVLTGQPRVRRGRDLLEGEVITFWRNENRMDVRPGAKLIIYPEKGGARDQFHFGK